MKIPCQFCDDPLDSSKAGTYKQVVAWVPAAKSGTPKLMSSATGWAHGICIEIQEKATRTLSQDGLF